MKSLEKDRSRRYESASALAADIQRYLSDEPVLACPPTTMYRFQKFARKHKPALATAAAIAACLILGTTVSAWQAARATTAEAQATINEAQAKASAQEAREKAQDATTQRDAAQRQRDEVKTLNDKLQNTLYAVHMNLARHAWDEAAASRVQELLNQHRPKAGEPDLRGFEWHYLNQLSHAEPVLVLKANFISVNSVVFSPDGKRIVSGTSGGTRGPSTAAGARISPQLKIWDAQTGQELFKVKAGSSANYGGGIVAFSPDGKRLASGAVDGVVNVWDVETGNELLSLKGHNGDITSVAFSPDGKRIASGSGDSSNYTNEGDKPGEVKLWDAETGQELLTLPGRTGDTESVAFSPDGKRLAHGVAGELKDGLRLPGAMKVCDLQTGREILSLEGGGGSVAFSADGRLIASRSRPGRMPFPTRQQDPGELKVWDAQTGQELPTFSEECDGAIIFEFSPDGKRLATAGQRLGMPRIKVFDTQTGREIFTLQRHADAVTSLAFSPDSQRLASSSADRSIRIWNLQSGQEIRTLNLDTIFISNVAFSPDGNRLASATFDGTVRVWDVRGDTVPLAVRGSRPTFNSDFKRVASVAADQTVSISDAQTGRELYSLKGSGTAVAELVFSPDDKLLAAASWSFDQGGLIRVWDTQTGDELLFLKVDHRVQRMAFSHDGGRLVAGSGGKMKVWDVRTHQELFTFNPDGGAGGYTGVVFSPDGKRLATGGNVMKVWDAQTGQELLSLKGQSQAAVAFSSDGKRLASGSLDGTIKVWDAQSGQEFLTFQGGHVYVIGIAFSPDGKRLASASMDRAVKVWDVHTGQEVLALKTQPSGAHFSYSPGVESHTVSFSPDGYRLASAHYRGSVTIWDATPLPEKP